MCMHMCSIKGLIINILYNYTFCINLHISTKGLYGFRVVFLRYTKCKKKYISSDFKIIIMKNYYRINYYKT